MMVQTGSAPRMCASDAGRSSPSRPIAVAIALLGGAMIGAAPLAAQGPGVFEVMASRRQESTAPLFGGISLSRYQGPIGIRFSGALNLTTARDSAGPLRFAPQRADCRRDCRMPPRQSFDDGLSPFPAIGGWNADIDLVFAPVRAVRPLRALLLGFSPYAFGGVGGYGARPVNGADTTRTTWSVGGGAHHDLLGWLGVGAEARYRQPFNSDSAFSRAWQHKLEYRVGLTISFGRRRPSPPSGDTVSTTVPASAPCGTVPCGSGKGVPASVDPRFASRLLDIADGLVDTPFESGGTTPRTGFDGAGFVRYVFAQQGVSLPRTASDMASLGSEVSTRVGALRAGDLLFFANDGTNINHVAIYAGRDRIVHATASGGGVRYDTLGEGDRGRWFADHLVSARRVGAADASAPRENLDSGERPDRAPRPQGASR